MMQRLYIYILFDGTVTFLPPPPPQGMNAYIHRSHLCSQEAQDVRLKQEFLVNMGS